MRPVSWKIAFSDFFLLAVVPGGVYSLCMDATKILSQDEIYRVLRDLHRRRRYPTHARVNLVIFRLACCCGLRRKEICGLNLGDLILTGPRPVIRVRKDITKGRPEKRRARLVPLWWDSGTLADLRAWVGARNGAPTDPLICSQFGTAAGRRLTTDLVSKRWRTAIRCLGADRARQVSVHCGRHTFCTHAVAGGRKLAEVRDAAGHRNAVTTSQYLHMLDNDVPDLFSFSKGE